MAINLAWPLFIVCCSFSASFRPKTCGFEYLIELLVKYTQILTKQNDNKMASERKQNGEGEVYF